MTEIRRNPQTIARLAIEAEAAAIDRVKEARRAAFTAEADPLFFKVQRGEAAEAEYQAKIAEIRARHPYPPAP